MTFGRTILVLEDDQHVGGMLKDVLEHDGHSVILETDGKSGLVAFGRNKIDIVIMDIVLPNLSGFDTIAKLRRTKKGRHTPLREFLRLPSLLYSANPDGKKTGGSEAGDHYTQAALLIEFLREDRKRKKQFPAFLQRMGKVPQGYMQGIADVFADLYGEDVDELDAAFQKWAKKR